MLLGGRVLYFALSDSSIYSCNSSYEFTFWDSIGNMVTATYDNINGRVLTLS